MTTFRSAVFNAITVQPNNPAIFPSYGVKEFGTDLNAAWASIPRADDVYADQNCEWVVTIPPGTYVPASNDLAIIGTTVAGSSELIDFGCSNPNLVGRAITGPGVAPGTTITRIYPKLGTFFATATYVAGSNVVTVGSTAALWVGQQVFSGGSAAFLPYCTITAILTPTTFQVSVNALQSSAAVSLTASASLVAVLSLPATSSNTAANFIVNLPLQITGTATLASATLTAVSYVCNPMIGQVVTGPNIPGGTTVLATSYNAATNQGTLTLSAPATGSGSGTYELQIPSVFFCDMQRRKIVNICTGPVELGQMAVGSPTQVPQPQFLTPMPGAAHFVDLHVQLGWTATIYGTRQGFAWGGTDNNTDAWSTHFAYLTKSRLSGSIVLLDPTLSSSPNQQFSFADLEVFGNPGRYLQSQRVCSTTLGSAVVTALTGDTTCLYPGQLVSGAGIAAGSYIVSIAGTNITLSAVATASNPAPGVSLLFNPGVITGSTVAGCSTTLNSTTLTLPGVNPTTGLYVGQGLSGAGIPTNTFIAVILSPTTVQMSQAATATGAAVAVTIAPAALSFDSSLLSATTTDFMSLYKSRFRSTLLAPKVELAMCENVEFSQFVMSPQYSHISSSAFKGGWLWTANSNNFDAPGLFGCQLAGGFTGAAAAPLRMDAVTNATLRTVTAPGTLVNNTPRQLTSDLSTGSAKLTGQTATIPTTTVFTPLASPVGVGDGLYQVSVYTSCTTAGAAGTMTATIGWTDDTTPQALALAALPLTVVGGFVQQTLVVKAKSATAITYAALLAGVVGVPAYALYVTVTPLT